MSNRLNIGEFVEEFKNKKIVIPLIQRNYRWEDGNEYSEYVPGKRNTAHNLVWEIINNVISNSTSDLMLGIIVFYQKDGVYQIIDGQQRLITLSLIWRYMQKNSSQNYTWVEFKFERDNEDEKRYKYLLGKVEETEQFGKVKETKQLGVDVSRMKKNYQEIERVFKWYRENKNLKLADVWKYICEHVSFVIRETNSEPIDEFLNINDYKTPFSLCDYIKVFLIQDICEINKNDINKIKSEKNNILNLIKEISCYLYSAEYSDVFKLVSSGYDIVNDDMRNNVDLLYTDCYGQSEINIKNIEFNTILSKYHEKSFVFERERLIYFKNVLKGIAEEIKTTTPDNKEHPNYNAFNAFYSLKRSMPNLRFFSMFKDEDIKNSKDPNSVMQKFCLQKFCAEQVERNNIKSVNDFIQSVLYSENKEDSNNDINDYSIDNSGIFDVAKDLFFKYHEQYTDIVIKGKNITESDELHKDSIQEKLEININDEENYADKILSNSIISVKELFEKTSKIIIPDIQREYIQGSGLDSFFKDICKKYHRKEIEVNPNNCTAFSTAIKNLEDNSVKNSDYVKIDNLDGKMDMIYKKCISNYIEKFLFSESDTDISYDDIIDNTGLNKSWRFDKRYTTINPPLLSAVTETIKKDARPYIEKIKESNISPDTTYTSSCIVGNLDTENNFYVYDGQQRITTFVCLTGCMIRKNKVDSCKNIYKKFYFIGREKANKAIETLYTFNGDWKDLLEELSKLISDQTTLSIYNIVKYFVRYFYDISSGDYKSINGPFLRLEYFWNNMKMDLYLLEEQDDLNQLFMDLNSGLKLTVEEKYKSHFNHCIMSSKVEDSLVIPHLLDNEFIDLFYNSDEGFNLAESEYKSINALKYLIICRYIERFHDKKMLELKDKDMKYMNDVSNYKEKVFNGEFLGDLKKYMEFMCDKEKSDKKQLIEPKIWWKIQGEDKEDKEDKDVLDTYHVYKENDNVIFKFEKFEGAFLKEVKEKVCKNYKEITDLEYKIRYDLAKRKKFYINENFCNDYNLDDDDISKEYNQLMRRLADTKLFREKREEVKGNKFEKKSQCSNSDIVYNWSSRDKTLFEVVSKQNVSVDDLENMFYGEKTTISISKEKVFFLELVKNKEIDDYTITSDTIKKIAEKIAKSTLNMYDIIKYDKKMYVWNYSNEEYDEIKESQEEVNVKGITIPLANIKEDNLRPYDNISNVRYDYDKIKSSQIDITKKIKLFLLLLNSFGFAGPSISSTGQEQDNKDLIVVNTSGRQEYNEPFDIGNKKILFYKEQNVWKYEIKEETKI